MSRWRRERWGRLGTAVVTACLSGGCGDVVEGPVLGEPTYVMQAATVTGDSLTVDGVALNERSRTIQYELLTPCPLTLRLYRADESVAAWDGLAWYNSQPGGCKRAPVLLTLDPGESRVHRVAVGVEQVLGDSLAEGEYDVSVIVWQGAPNTGPREVGAGVAVLARE